LSILKRHRAKRPRLRLDDKVIADWNCLAVAAITEAGLAFGRLDWINAADQAFNANRRALTATADAFKGRLHQSAVGGTPGAPATLQGLAEMARAALILFEATGKKDYLGLASKWAYAVVTHHWDEAGPTVARLKQVRDEPNASGNGKMTEVLALLYYLGGDARHQDRANHTLFAVGGDAEEPALEASRLYNAADTIDEAL